MTYPRTPDLHRGLSGVVRTNASDGDARVRYVLREGAMPDPPKPPSKTFEGHASASGRSYDSAGRLIGVPFSTEGSLAYGFSDAVALGGWLSLELLGAELRLQPLSARDGAPLSATLSLGVVHVGLMPSIDDRLAREGFGARGGLDLGVMVGADEILFGGYASYMRRGRDFETVPDDDPSDEHYPGLAPSLKVIRDELKLSVPLGYALRGERYAFIFGVVPEWTLDATLQDVRCDSCGDYVLDRFEQGFALYVTVGIEAWDVQRHLQP